MNLAQGRRTRLLHEAYIYTSWLIVRSFVGQIAFTRTIMMSSVMNALSIHSSSPMRTQAGLCIFSLVLTAAVGSSERSLENADHEVHPGGSVLVPADLRQGESRRSRRRRANCSSTSSSVTQLRRVSNSVNRARSGEPSGQSSPSSRRYSANCAGLSRASENRVRNTNFSCRDGY